MTTEKNTQKNTRALIIVDVQNDFVEGGSLAVAGGRSVASRISSHLATNAADYGLIVATRDWHTAGCTNGGHFAAEGTDPDYVDTWPVHCVAHAKGSDYAPELALRHVDLHVKKGMGEAAYSGFEGVTTDGGTLADALNAAGMVEVDVVGIATDYCVKATALDAAAAGFKVRVIMDLTAAVNPANLSAVVDELAAAGVSVEGALAAA